MRCDCGEQELLDPSFPMVAFQTTAHCPGRCGAFIKIEVRGHFFPAIYIQWPGEFRPYRLKPIDK